MARGKRYYTGRLPTYRGFRTLDRERTFRDFGHTAWPLADRHVTVGDGYGTRSDAREQTAEFNEYYERAGTPHPRAQ